MESNSESKGANFEVKLNELKKRLGDVIEDTAEAWFNLLPLKSIPVVPGPAGLGVLPVTLPLKQINQQCLKLSGMFEAMSMLDPSLLCESKESDGDELISSVEKTLKPLEESIEQIKQAINEAQK